MLELVLPFPPSVNDYWVPVPIRGKGGRQVGSRLILSEDARKYRRTVHSILGERTPIEGGLAMTMVYEAPALVRVRDLDNYNKGLWDSLTHCKVWCDDSQVDEYHVYRGPVGSNRVLITLQEINS